MTKRSGKASLKSGSNSFPIDNASVETTWREALTIQEFGGTARVKSRKRLAQAQVARMQAESEAITATKDYCVRARAQADNLIEEAEGALAHAERIKASANARSESMEEEIQFRLKDASDKRKNARSYAEQLEIATRGAADALMNQTREGAKELASRMRHTAAEDIRKILGDIESARAAAEDELAAQQLLTDTAKIKVGIASFESIAVQGEPMTFAPASKKKAVIAKKPAVRAASAKAQPARSTAKITNAEAPGSGQEPDWDTLRTSKNYRDSVKALKSKPKARAKAKSKASKSVRKAA